MMLFEVPNPLSKRPIARIPKHTIYTLFIPDSTKDLLQSDEDFSDFEDSDSDYDLKLTNGKTDSNFKYLDEVSEDLQPKSF